MSRVTVMLLSSVLLACGDNGNTNNPPPPPVDAANAVDAPAQPLDAPADAAAPNDHGLVLDYEFEDSSTTVTDSSIHLKNGTLSDATAWTASGRTGRGLALSAPNGIPATQYVSLPDGVLTGVGDFSVAFWLKLNTVTDWARIYDFGNGQADAANRFMYFCPSGFAGTTRGVHVDSFTGATTTDNVLNTGTQLPAGVWKHVVVTGTGTARTLYIDGFPAMSETAGPEIDPSEMEPLAPNSWLGKSRFATDPGLDGTLDEFRIYDRVLAQSEISQLAWPQHDYSDWRFDDATGTTAADSSDNAITGVLANGITWDTAGRLGGAIAFPGGAAGATGPTLTLAANPLANCTNQLTISTWMKLNDTTTVWQHIFNFGASNGTAFINMVPTDGAGMHFAMVSPAGAFDLVSATPPIADNNWHHVAVTVDTTGLATIYVDGASIASATSAAVKVSDFAAASIDEYWLGKSPFMDAYLNASLDELRIGCRALTADEIKNLAAAQ
jgi:hypothetical protein